MAVAPLFLRRNALRLLRPTVLSGLVKARLLLRNGCEGCCMMLTGTSRRGCRMFDRKTVFIIGAGAGVEIDMPVGSQLSRTIADKTYIRHKDFGPELLTGDYAVSNALKRITKARGLNYNDWRAEACAIRDGIF